MHILIAPNAFKNSLTAGEAANAIREGLMASNLDCTCECFPIGDGGDGTGELIVKKLQGETFHTRVSDPFGRKIDATLGLIKSGKTAVIEMAAASGLRLLKTAKLNPLLATSYGTGEQIKAALDIGAEKIVLCLGGSATVDGGTGMLSALGIRFLDANRNDLRGLPASLVQLKSVDISGLDKRMHACEVVVLCDVNNHLLGEQGSAAIFGPQKGASAEAVRQLDAALSNLSRVTQRKFGMDMSAIRYGGTAGGAAAGLNAFLNARLVSGIGYFLEITDFKKALEKCDLLITGEGSIDEQTLQGKAPFGVAAAAKEKGVDVIGLAGKVPLSVNTQLHKYFNILVSINHNAADLATALRHTYQNLQRTSFELGNLLALTK